MEIKYFKETILDGHVLFVAKNIETGQNIVVSRTGSNLFQFPTDTSTCTECTREEFATAYSQALENMAMFLLGIKEVKIFPTCHKCGTALPSKDIYFQKCKTCYPNEL